MAQKNVLGSDGIEKFARYCIPFASGKKMTGRKTARRRRWLPQEKRMAPVETALGKKAVVTNFRNLPNAKKVRKVFSSKDGKTISDAGERRDISLSFSALFSRRLPNPVSAFVYTKVLFTEKEAPKRYGAYHLDQAEAGDVFTYRLYAEGCYIYYRTDVVTEEDIRTGQKNISYTLDRRAGEGYEAKTVYRWPEVLKKKLFDAGGLTGVDRSLWIRLPSMRRKRLISLLPLKRGCEYLRNLCNEKQAGHIFLLLGGKQPLPRGNSDRSKSGRSGYT